MDVSILITSYNYKNFLPLCLKSCIEQRMHNMKYEIIVVDDGSNDGTKEILKQTLPEIVRVFHIDNCGIEKASNFGFKKCRGKYILRVDADDFLYPGYLSEIQKYLNNDFGFFYPDYDVIGNKGEIISNFFLPSFSSEEILSRGDFLATGTLIHSKHIENFGGYNSMVCNSGLENYEFILDLIHSGITGFHVPKTLFGYRRHSNNISKLKRDSIIRHGKKLFQIKRYGNFMTNEYHPYGLKV